MVTIHLNKEVATTALQTYLNTLKRKRDKEANMLICELLDKDISIVQNAINTISDAKK